MASTIFSKHCFRCINTEKKSKNLTNVNIIKLIISQHFLIFFINSKYFLAAITSLLNRLKIEMILKLSIQQDSTRQGKMYWIKKLEFFREELIIFRFILSTKAY